MKRKFKELYYLGNNLDEETEFDLTIENDFVFCWKNNWFYFTSKVHENCIKIENVKFKKWIFKESNPIWIDYDEELDLNLIYLEND